MAVSSVTNNKPVLPRTTDNSDLGSNRASVYSGKGLSFDGVNDLVDLGTQSCINEEGFTISLYAKLDDDTEHYIFTTGYASTNSILLFSPSSSNEVRLSWYDGSTAPNTSGITYVNGEWFHVAVTYDGSTIKIFKNGEEVVNESYSISSIDEGLYELGWATQRNKSTAYLQGDLSDFKIFNTTLTANQVAELYDNPEQAVPTGVDATSLVIHLPMTEGAGSYLYNANVNAIGTELISNAGFDETCQKWGTTDSSTVEISGGKAIWTNAPLSGSFVEQPLDLEVGKFYRVKFDYTSTAFNIFVNLGDTQQAVPLGNGTYVYDMYYGSGTASLKFKHGYTTNSSATVDNVSVKEVVPTFYNGTINGATWVSGLPEPLPQTALMDWNKVDINTSVNSNDYYSGNITIGSSSGTIICRHIPYTSNTNVYYYGLGSNNTGYQRAIGSSSNKYWSVGYGTSPQDFTTNATVDLGDVTDISNSWDADGNVTIHKNGNFIQTVSKTLSDITGTRSVYLYRSAWASGNEQAIVFWAYYDRKLTTKEINDVYTGAVDPEDVADLKYFFSKSNGYSYNGVTLTKTGSFTEQLSQEGSTSGKDVFGNTISNPRASGAYNFDGASWAEVDDNASLDITDAITLECWFYWNNITSKGIFGRWHQDSNNRNYLLWKSSDTRVDFYINGSTVAQYYSLNATKGWTHIVGVYDRNTAKIYIDGVDVASSSHSLAITTSTMPLEIGRNFTTVNQAINSQLAQPRIYNYALTAEQVADNYNEKASTFGGTKVTSELQAYIERTNTAGATVEAHSCLLNYLTELDKK